jgi:peptidoglycan/LPS O-acetylase OafA/YrhL
MLINRRLDLDGLRAIAVFSIIIYHANITIFGNEIFKSGFFGVDIFFVISGYLITLTILNELTNTGTFSFSHFYEKRIRRIFPTLFFVIFVSIPFAWIYLVPNNLIDYFKSIITSLSFSSNFYFWFSGKQFGMDGLKPFLHTWSLSVLVQYYIIFPLCLYILFKYFRKFLIYILIIGLLISLVLADWGSKNHSSFNFFVLPTRIWELLAGSILAYFEIINGHRSKNKMLNSLLPSIGFLLIGCSLLFFNVKMFHPSFYTLTPIIGVCLIIWFSNKDELTTKILSNKLFVAIGLISYPLYLWHYPILLVARINGFIQGDIINKILIILLILILSVFSYHFIEKFFRNKKNKFKDIFSIIILNYLIFFSLHIFLLKNESLMLDRKNFEYNVLENTRGIWEKCAIDEIINDNYCKIGAFDNKVFLIGDSHLLPLINDLGKKLNQKNYELNNLIQPALIYRGKSKSRDDKRVNFLKNIKNSILIFGGYYHRIDKDELNLIYNYYKEDFELFLKNNNKIIFLTPIPTVPFDPIKELNLVMKNKKIDISINKTDVIKRNKLAINFINKFKDISILDLNNIFCDMLKCYAISPDKIILKSDDDHPSLKGAEMMNDLIMKEIEKIELKFN